MTDTETHGVLMELPAGSLTPDKIFRFAREITRAGLVYPQIINIVAESLAHTSDCLCILLIHTPDQRWLKPIVSECHFDVSDDSINQVTHYLFLACTSEEINTVMPTSRADYSMSDPDLDLEYDQLIKYFTKWIDHLPINIIYAARLGDRTNVFGYALFVSATARSHGQETINNHLEEIVVIGALAIENARLHAVEVNRSRELQALHKATATLLTSLDQEILLGQILDAAMTAIPSAEVGELHLIAPETGRLELRAALGYSDPRIKRLRTTKIHPYTAKALQTRKALITADLSSSGDRENGQKGDISRNAGKSLIIAPLMLNEAALGALTLSSKMESAFTESDLNLLVNFAGTTTAALNNAKLHAEVQKLSITDALTNLYNRRGVLEVGRREIERARRFKHPLSVMMLDIDNFKQINDNFGHVVGDRVLIILASVLQNNTRSVDILGRYGGDEFIILLPETDMFTASAAAERVLKVVAGQCISTEKGDVTYTISIGLSKAVADTQDLASLIENTDTALYFAKQRGKNRIEIA